MARKTRKKINRKKGVMTIPELRRSFEYMESMIKEMTESHETREKMVSQLRKEWRTLFHRELPKHSAEEFVDHRITQEKEKAPSRRRRTIRRRGGMAPIDYQPRAGLYLAPGQIPTPTGSLPLSSGAASAYGSFTDYISKGFGVTVPIRAEDLDPIKGQAEWPVPMKGGSGLFGPLVDQAAMRPFGPSVPNSPLNDIQRIVYGSSVGPSPSVPQRSPDYLLGKVYSGPL